MFSSACTTLKVHGRNIQSVEMENMNNWGYGTRIIRKEIENTKSFYFRVEWIRNMIKGSELMSIEKVDQEQYAPLTLK